MAKKAQDEALLVNQKLDLARYQQLAASNADQVTQVRKIIEGLGRDVTTADEAREILRESPGILVIDKHEPGGYITPHEAAGEDAGSMTTFLAQNPLDLVPTNESATATVQPAQQSSTILGVSTIPGADRKSVV